MIDPTLNTSDTHDRDLATALNALDTGVPPEGTMRALNQPGDDEAQAESRAQTVVRLKRELADLGERGLEAKRRFESLAASGAYLLSIATPEALDLLDQSATAIQSFATAVAEGASTTRRMIELADSLTEDELAEAVTLLLSGEG